ncbi:MAG: transketolase C-terminal domain-containing protein [Parvularculaceae bacterium]
MGDLVTQAVSGTLYYADKDVFDRVGAADAPAPDRAALFADLARLNALTMIAGAGSGHIGSSFSSMDIVAWLYLEHMRDGDIYFSSKGHDAPGLYAVLSALGHLPFDAIHRLRRIDGLPGHPDIHVDGMEANTGSLGMGISKAKGMAFAHRLRGEDKRIYVMTGDGELQEGQIWESLVSAANDELGEITVIVDHNKFQSDYAVARTSDLGDLAAKFAAFGWHTQEIDGHDFAGVARALIAANETTGRPSVIIAHTVKGKGVSFMEGARIDSDVERFRFHSGAPNGDDYAHAVEELVSRINERSKKTGLPQVRYETVRRPPATPETDVVRLIPAYTEALLTQAKKNERIIALDADLVVDMGLEPFREKFPERFVECGIAEMDMASQAGGMALKGFLPVVHSFACFLSTRPNEQIYNNATEGTKIVYVGGLAGLLPAGPGHSHQSVRDVSALGSVPGMAMVEPAHPSDVAPLLDWCVNVHDGPSYVRLASIPYSAPYEPQTPESLKAGRGWAVRDGEDAVIIASGLVCLAQAYDAAERLRRKGVSVGVANMPWLNNVDDAWLAETFSPVRAALVIENHYERLGLADILFSAWARAGGQGVALDRIGLTNTPPCGANDEVLQAVGFQPDQIGERVLHLLERPPDQARVAAGA